MGCGGWRRPGSGRWCCRRCSRNSSPTTSWSWTGCWRPTPTPTARPPHTSPTSRPTNPHPPPDQLELDRLLETTADGYGEATSYFPDLQDYNTGPWTYLDHITQAKRALSVPVIASLNGITPGGWVGHAKGMREAGADALELTLYTVATDPRVGAAELETRYLDLVTDVRAAISIPLAVKLSPFYTRLANVAVPLGAR